MLVTMGWYTEQVLPRLQNRLLDLGETRRLRARICENLSGDVVEIGFGSGLNLPHLPTPVTGVWAIEPSAVGRSLAAERVARAAAPVTFAGLDGQQLPFPDDRFDAGLSTWSLCTIPDPVLALREVRRVLRPGGRFHFLEHGLSADAGVARWQHRFTPVQRRLAGGCHLDRNMSALLTEAGFQVTELATYYEKTGPRILGHMYEGRAVAAT